MKLLLILCVLTQWSAFGEDCPLTFDNKEPSHILEQMEQIYSMDIDQGLFCFNRLKTFLTEEFSSAPADFLTADAQNTRRLLPYRDDRQENMERIEYLMSLLLTNSNNTADITPQAHPALREKNLFFVKTTLTHINQKRSLSSRPPQEEDEEYSQTEKQIKQFQSQPQHSVFLNPYLGFAPPLAEPPSKPPISSEDAEDSPPDITAVNLYDAPEGTRSKEHLWTETIHIEFPSIVLCKQPMDSTAKIFAGALKIYENAVTDFANNNTDTDLLYTDTMKWIHLEKNQEGQSLQNSHSTFDTAVYNVNIHQIPDFILSGMTSEQRNSFTYMMNLVRKYIWMKNLYFEYRKCLPQIFREHIRLSYTAPTPFDKESFEVSPGVGISYELSSYTPPFASSFKQNTPLRSLQESHIQWDNFHSNNIRNKYESEWISTLQFLQNFISQKRTYLNVSF